MHTHSSLGSFLDSTNRPEELPKRAKELNMDAIAITEHGYTSSHIEFYKACKQEGIKPLLGIEFYICSNMEDKESDNRYDHLIAIAKNKQGYKNLLKLSSLGFTNGFYYKPRIDMKTLNKYKDGLVIMTACIGGTIPKMILSGQHTYEDIKKEVMKYSKIFDDFYLEIQSADNESQRIVNQTLVKLSKETGIPLVVSSDVHFLYKDDLDLHGVFIQINQSRDNEVYQDCWLKSEEEVIEVLSKQIDGDSIKEAINNTHKIAEICNVELELGVPYLPSYKVPEGFKSEDEYLWYLANEGIKSRGIDKYPKDLLDRYIDRMKYEFGIISKKGFSGYFLIVRDFIKLAKQNKIVIGYGRGSVGGSLIAYLIDITNIDSVKYDLPFSRFLTIERKGLPD